MTPDVHKWHPLAIEDIQRTVGSFTEWVLCGGRSLDWMFGETTRNHEDTDIGVFRSQASECLTAIGAGRVFLCNPPGTLLPWDGSGLPADVHDIWIADESCANWTLQLLVYDDTAETVVYRRDPRITWVKASHSLTIRGIEVLNPIVTLLFKLHTDELRDRDCADVTTLIAAMANNRLNNADSPVPPR